MRIAVILVLLTATARAEPAKETAAEKSAKAWLATLLDARAALPTPGKDKPLDYVIDSPAKSCRALKSGRATTAAQAGNIKKCVLETWKGLADEPPASSGIGEWEPGPNFGGFPKKHHAAMKASAKDATVIQAEHIGDGNTMTVAIVVAKDGAIRAVWMQHGEFE